MYAGGGTGSCPSGPGNLGAETAAVTFCLCYLQYRGRGWKGGVKWLVLLSVYSVLLLLWHMNTMHSSCFRGGDG